jgi:prephenate dehydrogenase
MAAIRHIHVFGGLRGIGRWFVEHVFQGRDLSVSVYDIDIPSSPQLAPGVAVRHIHYRNGTLEGVPAFGPTDAIVLAVPVGALRQTCAALFPRLPDGCLVFDMSSIKREPHAIMEQHSAGRLTLLGTHPLFGPQLASPVGQTVVLTGFDANNERHAWLYHLLRSRGFIIQQTTPEQHDEYMLYIQVLTHFVLLTFARVLVDRQRSMSELLNFKTPPFAFLTAFAGRLLGGNALTYASIQRLEGAEELRAAIVQAAQELAADFAPGSDTTAAAAAIRALVEPFRGSEISECFAISGRAIDSVQQNEQRLFELAESGRLCGLQRGGSERVYIGVIQDVGADRILFEERARRIKSMGGKYAVFTGEHVRESYQAIGIAFGSFRRFELLKRHIRVLPDSELHAWLEQHMLTLTRDVNVRARLPLAREFYETLLPRLVPDLVAAQFVEYYRESEYSSKITLSITHRPDSTTPDMMRRIEDVLAQVAGPPA